MRTKNTRKGFTTVELVIVIAVIAILATVLIPTFSNLINQANLSADKQNVRNMNTVLMTYITDGDPKHFGVVRQRLLDGGYKTGERFEPKSAGFKYYWYVDEVIENGEKKNISVILLVDENDTEPKVVYPEEYTTLSAAIIGNVRLCFDLSLPAAKITDDTDLGIKDYAGNSHDLAIKYVFEIADEADSSEYKDWYADFHISFKNSDGTTINDYSKIEGTVFAGYFPGWELGSGKDTPATEWEDWLTVPMGGRLLTFLQSNGGEFAMVGDVLGFKIKYGGGENVKGLYEWINGVFKCGVADVVGDKDAGIVMNVELRLTNSEDEDDIKILGIFEYEFK